MRTIGIKAKVRGQEEIQLKKSIAEDALFGCPLISTYVAANNSLRSLAVGQRTTLQMIRFEVDPEFEIVEANLNIERKDDVDKKEANGKVLRRYTIKDTRRNGSYEGALIMDEQGRPTSFESAGQMGSFQTKLIEPFSTLR